MTDQFLMGPAAPHLRLIGFVPGLAFFHGNRHVVKIQRQRRFVKQFQPHGRVEQSIRLMHVLE